MLASKGMSTTAYRVVCFNGLMLLRDRNNQKLRRTLILLGQYNTCANIIKHFLCCSDQKQFHFHRGIRSAVSHSAFPSTLSPRKVESIMSQNSSHFFQLLIAHTKSTNSAFSHPPISRPMNVKQTAANKPIRHLRTSPTPPPTTTTFSIIRVSYHGVCADTYNINDDSVCNTHFNYHHHHHLL